MITLTEDKLSAILGGDDGMPVASWPPSSPSLDDWELQQLMDQLAQQQQEEWLRFMQSQAQ